MCELYLLLSLDKLETRCALILPPVPGGAFTALFPTRGNPYVRIMFMLPLECPNNLGFPLGLIDGS